MNIPSLCKVGKREALDLFSTSFLIAQACVEVPSCFLLSREYSLTPSTLALTGKVLHLLCLTKFLQTLVMVPFVKSVDQ